jgi:8-oxo-dGTP pyrophosphatase MutT (NUDIX family)
VSSFDDRHFDERASLLNLLKNYVPTDNYQILIKSRFLDFVASEPSCFLRSNLLAHITGSCWLLDPLQENVLLTHHKKLNKWLQLGGHADGESDILHVALREAHEESGIVGCSAINEHIFDLDIHEIPEHKGVPAHFHYDVRFALSAPHKNFKISSESHGLAWVSIVKLASDVSTHESLRRMAKLWLRKNGSSQ